MNTRIFTCQSKFASFLNYVFSPTRNVQAKFFFALAEGSSLRVSHFRNLLMLALLTIFWVSESWAVPKSVTITANIAYASIVWSPVGAPIAGDDVTITCNGTFSITAIPSSIPASGNFASFTTTGTGTLTLTGTSSTIFTTRLVCNANTTLSSLSFNQTALTSATSSIAAARTLTIPTVCFVGIGTGGILTVSGTIAINGNATGLLTSANTQVVVASGGAVNYTLTGQACQPAAMTVQSGGTLHVNGSSSTNTISQFPAAGISMAGTLRIQGNLTTVGGSNAITYSGTTSTIWYNAISFPTAGANEWPTTNPPANVNINLTITANVINIPSDRTISGTLTMTGGRLGINGNTLTLQGTISLGSANACIRGSVTSNLTVTGNNVVSNPLFFDATTVGATNQINNLILNRTGTTPNLTLGSALVMGTGGTLTLTAGTLTLGAVNPALTINGLLSAPAGTITGSTSAGLVIGGTGNMGGSLVFTSGAQAVFNLTMSRTSSGVATLGSPLAIGGGTVTGVLTLTNGILVSTSTNLATLINRATGAVSGGSATSYVQGPLRRDIPNNASAATYVWPVGEGANYRPIELVSLTTSGTAGNITAECKAGATGGTAGPGLTSISSSRFYEMSVNTVTINTTTVRITESGLSSTTSRIGQSATQGGAYMALTNLVAPSTTIQSTPSLNYALNYFVVATSGNTLCGNYTVGPTGDFAKLYNVANALNAATLTCDCYFEFQSTYVGTSGEIAPIAFQEWANTGGPWSVYIRPLSGVASMLTTSADPGTGADLITFHGADRLTFDGQPGGAGGTGFWTLRNTRTAATVGPTIDFLNHAQNNTLKYLTVEGQNITTTSGTVYIGSNSVAGTGNDNILIDYCTIRDRSDATGYPANAIYSGGTAFVNRENSDNTISNCNIFNFTTTGILANATNNGSNWTISDNSLYSTVTATTAQTGISFGSTSTDDGHVISGNYVGGNAPLAAGTWTNSGNVVFVGLQVDNVGTTVPTQVSGNIIRNISMSSNSTTARFNGININSTGDKTVSGNEIYSITSVSTNTGTSSAANMIGIVCANNMNLSGNKVYSLSNTAASATAIHLYGIYGAPTPVVFVKKNLVHSLGLNSTSATAKIVGIFIAGSTTSGTVENNMVRLGIKADGTAVTTGLLISGIEKTTASVVNVYHNSVFIGGTGVGTGTGSTYAFIRSSSPASVIEEISNNIFWNARSNNTTGGKHYAISLNNNTNIASDYNDLYVSGTGGVFGSFSAADQANIGAWRTASSQDANSINNDPKFINATGNASAVDLHIMTSPTATPIEASGINVASVTEDYDGETRSAFTPTDMGADASDFEPIDLTAPTVSYTAITGACSGAATYSLGSVSITDASGVNVTAGTAPRVYYKKSTNANSLGVTNDNTTDGWKWVEANGTTSPFNFTIDYSLLNGGNPVLGTVLQYFVVAQDEGVNVGTPNVAIKSNTATFAATQTSVALASGAFPIGGTPNSFTIVPCSGTVTVGSTGSDYTAFTTATGIFQAINIASAASLISGNLTVNVTTSITIEDGVNGLNEFASPYTLTIQSDAATNRDISSAAGYNGALFRLLGADRVTFNGGSSADRYLTLRNTSTGTSAATLQFLNDATNNNVHHCIIEGAGTLATTGVVFFGTTTGTTGNDNNTIDNCDIRDLTTATAYPYNCVYALGTLSKANDNNMISNCNISNFYTGSTTCGILVSTYNTLWTISGNRIFQIPRSGAINLNMFGIYINNSTDGSGFTISNNTIGYANSAGTGTFQFPSTSNFRLNCIYLTALSSGTVNNITGNTITNISMSTTSGGAAAIPIFTGIYVSSGKYLIDGNTIGATTGTGSIAVTGSTVLSSTTPVSGIYTATTATGQTISNNNIGSITATISGNFASYLYGIYISTGSVSISGGNTIGGSTANSIQTSSAATTATLVTTGIAAVSGAAYTVDISGTNTIQNLTTTGNPSSAAQVAGITTSGGGTYSISGTIVRNLSTNSTSTGTTTSSSVLGISLNSGGTLAHTISANQVYALSNTSTANNTVTGIYFSGSSATDIVSKNFVYNLQPASGASSIVTGIHLAGTAVAASNNMVRLGFDASGTAITNTPVITGISKDNTAINNSLYYNSVYIGGSGVGTTANNTYAFRKVQTGSTDNVRNNIFVNARSNNTTGGKHYGVYHNNGTTLTQDYNLIYVSGTGGIFGYTGSADQATFTLWKNNTAFDDNSVSANPQFANPTAATPNLNLSTTLATSAESGAVVISGLTDDFGAVNVRTGYPLGGQANGGGTAPDIGADEGDFIPADVTPPAFSYTSIPTQGLCLPAVTTVSVTVTDAQSGISLTANKPRMYFRRSTPNEVWSNTQFAEGVNASGNTNSSVWTFTLTYSNYSITPAGGNVFEYYFVAQDLNGTPNVGYSQSNGIVPLHSPDVAGSTTLTLPIGYTFPASGTYSFGSPLSGTVTVGSGGTYATFNGASGLFAAINTNGIGSDLLVNVKTGTIAEGATLTPLTAVTSYCGGPWTITIKPEAGATPTVTGSNAAAILQLKGADNVTIDGSNTVGGTTRDMTIASTNAGTATVVIWITSASTSDGAINITIKNCKVTGNTNTTTLAGILAGSYLTVGNPAESSNSTLTIINNLVTKCAYGINVNGNGSSYDADYNISNNVLGSTSVAADKINQGGIGIGNLQNFTVSNNQIQGVSTVLGNYSYGIELYQNFSNGTISGNTISDIKNTGGGAYGCYGIGVLSSSTSSNVTFFNNVIYDVAATGASAGSPSGFSSSPLYPLNGYGIFVYQGGGYNFYYNSVSLVTNQTLAMSFTAPMYVTSLVTTSNSINIRNNIFSNTQTVGSSRYAIYSSAASSVYANINYNDYWQGTGTLGFIGAANRTTIAAWRTGTGQDAQSVNVLPGFISATNLHLQGTSGLNALGTPISGITTDIDGDPRSGTPDIGADEFAGNVPPDCANITSPVNGSTTTPPNLTPVLLWQTALGATSYDVYFSTSATPTFVTNTTSLSYDAGCLEPNTTYYWQIIPKNGYGDATGCAIQSFTTMGQLAIYIQNFETWSEGMLSQITPQDGWLANTTADQSGGFGYRNVWSVHNETGAVSGNSMGVSAYYINAPDAGGGEFTYYNDVNTDRFIYRQIPSTGFKDITVNFNYTAGGEWSGSTGIDRGSVIYNPTGVNPSSTANWLEDPAQGGNFDNNQFFNQSTAAAEAILLPTDADNNANLYVAFRWTSNNNAVGAGSFVVDDIVVAGCPEGGNITPLSSSFTGSGSATLTLNNTHSCAKRQWQQSPAATGPWTDISGATGTTYSTGTVTTTTYYRCEISFGTCAESYQATPAVVTITSSCTAQTLTARANGTASSLTICTAASVTLTANPTGGSNCSGTFEYAWANGTNYWNGTAFASATAVYNASYTSISTTPAANTTYTAFVKCSADAACVGNSAVAVIVLSATAAVTADIGAPPNGTSHYINIGWNAVTNATAYDIEYSTNGSAWNALATNLTDPEYSHNTGDNPNAPYYYRVRATNGGTSCSWTEMTTPRYTAADEPVLPVVNGATSTTLNVTLQVETPVANPANTTYSIYEDNTGLYVQANGTMGATEVFQTKATWGTKTVTGLSNNTQYCFNAVAKNNDGDTRGGASGTATAQPFNASSDLNTSYSAPTNKWWSPASCTTGGLVWNGSNGCTGGAVGFSGSFNNFYGCFLRTPSTNCTGLNTVTLTFDVSHSYFAAQPDDHMRIYYWADGAYHNAITSLTINGSNAYANYGANGEGFNYSVARTCAEVEVVFDISAITNKSSILFYMEPNCGYNNGNVFFTWLDNPKVDITVALACATTSTCTAGTWTANDATDKTNWFDADNWSCNTIPIATTDVVIPTNPTGGNYFPMVTHATLDAVTKNLTIQTGASVTVNYSVTAGVPDGELQVNGVLTNNSSTTSMGSGFLTLKAGSSIAGNLLVDYLKIDGNSSLSASASIGVKKELALLSGTFTVPANATLTLESDINGTGYINDFDFSTAGPYGTLTGNVTIERYIPTTGGANTFHYIGGVTSATAGSKWSDDFNMSVTGTTGFITPGNCDPANPTTAQGSNYGGFFSYHESNVTSCYLAGWKVEDVNYTIAPGRGIAARIPNATTIEETGAYQKANVTLTNMSKTATNAVAYSQGYNLVSNPYFAPIDWSEVAADNTGTWDGAAYVYSPVGGTYSAYNFLTTALTLNTNQAFFVRAAPSTSPSASLSFTFNADTRTKGTNTTFYKQQQGYAYGLNINVQSGNGKNDNTLLAFDSLFTDVFDNGLDAMKLYNDVGVPSLYTKSGSDMQAIQALPLISAATRSVPLSILITTNSTHTFTFNGIEDLPQTTIVWLEDLKTGTIQYLRQNNVYAFAANVGDDKDRFMLHFTPELLIATTTSDCSGNNGTITLDQRGGIEWAFRLKDTNDAVITSDVFSTTELINQLAPGTYTLDLTHPASGYATTMTIIVTGLQPVTAALDAPVTAVLENETFTVDAQTTGATTYTWQMGDGTTFTDVTSVNYAYATPGAYDIIFTASNDGCSAVSTIKVSVSKQDTVSTGVGSVESGNIRIFENNDVLFISQIMTKQDVDARVTVYNALGQIIAQADVKQLAYKAVYQMPVSAAAGIYYVHVELADGEKALKKVLLGEDR